MSPIWQAIEIVGAGARGLARSALQRSQRGSALPHARSLPAQQPLRVGRGEVGGSAEDRTQRCRGYGTNRVRAYVFWYLLRLLQCTLSPTPRTC